MRNQMFEFEHEGDEVRISIDYDCDGAEPSFATARSLRIGGTDVEDDSLALKLLGMGAPNWLSTLDCSGQ